MGLIKPPGSCWANSHLPNRASLSQMFTPHIMTFERSGQLDHLNKVCWAYAQQWIPTTKGNWNFKFIMMIRMIIIITHVFLSLNDDLLSPTGCCFSPATCAPVSANGFTVQAAPGAKDHHAACWQGSISSWEWIWRGQCFACHDHVIHYCVELCVPYPWLVWDGSMVIINAGFQSALLL